MDDRPHFTKELIAHDVIAAWDDKIEPRDRHSIDQDYGHIYEQVMGVTDAFAGTMEPAEQPLYTATAGSPCSGKSTTLENELLGGSDQRYGYAAHIDPDLFLPLMSTHKAVMAEGMQAGLSASEASTEAYRRCRAGSNVMAYNLLNEAFGNGLHIAHGTTSTAAITGQLLADLGTAGYERRMMLFYASDTARDAAREKRLHVDNLHPVAVDDFEGKARLFPQRHADYFAHADHIILFWKPELEQPAIRAAEFKNGILKVFDHEAYGVYADKYENDQRALQAEGIIIPDWLDLQETYYYNFAKPDAPKGLTIESPDFPLAKPA